MTKLRIILSIIMMSILFCVGCGKKDEAPSESSDMPQGHSQDDGHDHGSHDGHDH